MGKRKSSAYQSVLTTIQGFVRLMLYILIFMVVIYIGQAAYRFGYMVFDTEPLAKSEDDALYVTVVIHEGDSVYQIGETLANKGLFENAAVFWAQEKLTDYEGEIQPGTYFLNTSQTLEEMFAILTGQDTEGQPIVNTDGETNEDSSTDAKTGIEKRFGRERNK